VIFNDLIGGELAKLIRLAMRRIWLCSHKAKPGELVRLNPSLLNRYDKFLLTPLDQKSGGFRRA
jgi:hypothetical protein